MAPPSVPGAGQPRPMRLVLDAGEALAVSADTLVAGVHFPPGTSVEAIGHKALAVNLSDLAAMGARPRSALITLIAPAREPEWLEDFVRGASALACDHGLDEPYTVFHEAAPGTPLTVTVQVHGGVPAEAALRRSGAAAGDAIYVTGTLGDAGLALSALRGEVMLQAVHRVWLRQRLDRPTPRVALGLALRGIASAAIDLSDGLARDLGQVLVASDVGATVEVARLPLSIAVRESLPPGQAWRNALGAGDDYELCVTVPEDRVAALERLGGRLDCAITRIGTIERPHGLRYQTPDGRPLGPVAGYEHFVTAARPGPGA